MRIVLCWKSFEALNNRTEQKKSPQVVDILKKKSVKWPVKLERLRFRHFDTQLNGTTYITMYFAVCFKMQIECWKKNGK